MAIVSDHLLSFVWHMGAHGGQPLQGIEHFFFFPVLGFIDNCGLFGDVLPPTIIDRVAFLAPSCPPGRSKAYLTVCVIQA